MYRDSCFDGFAALPETHRALLDAASEGDYFCSPAWFEHLMKHFYPGAHQVRVYALELAASGAPLLLMPLRACHIDYSAFGARTLGSISHPENYAPVAMIFSADVPDRERLLIHLLKYLRRGGADSSDLPVDLLRLWPVDTATDDERMLRRALREAGVWVQGDANPYNRYEDTVGLS